MRGTPPNLLVELDGATFTNTISAHEGSTTTYLRTPQTHLHPQDEPANFTNELPNVKLEGERKVLASYDETHSSAEMDAPGASYSDEGARGRPKKLGSTSEHERKRLEQGRAEDNLLAGSGGTALHGMSGNLSAAETRECVGCCGCGTTNETIVVGREGISNGGLDE